jgi:hypothetical protein
MNRIIFRNDCSLEELKDGQSQQAARYNLRCPSVEL